MGAAKQPKTPSLTFAEERGPILEARSWQQGPAGVTVFSQKTEACLQNVFTTTDRKGKTYSREVELHKTAQLAPCVITSATKKRQHDSGRRHFISQLSFYLKYYCSRGKDQGKKVL